MTTFYLIRHGQEKRIKGDPPLSEVGIKQARLTANYLEKYPFHRVFSSPIKRAMQTATIIAQALDLKLKIDKNLKERINWGDDPEQSFDDFLKTWEYTSNNRDFKPKAGDSSRRAGKRLEKVLKNLAKKHLDEQIVLVTHGGVITDLLRNLFSEKVLRKHYQDFPEKREKYIEKASITILAKNNKEFILKKIGSVEHFPFPIE